MGNLESKRERIVQAIRAHWHASTNEIAKGLGVSPHTVAKYRKQLGEKPVIDIARAMKLLRRVESPGSVDWRIDEKYSVYSIWTGHRLTLPAKPDGRVGSRTYYWAMQDRYGQYKPPPLDSGAVEFVNQYGKKLAALRPLSSLNESPEKMKITLPLKAVYVIRFYDAAWWVWQRDYPTDKHTILDWYDLPGPLPWQLSMVEVATPQPPDR